MKCHEVESLFQYDLPGVLKLRVPGTPEHDIVKDVIITLLYLSLSLCLCPPTIYHMISEYVVYSSYRVCVLECWFFCKDCDT